MCSVAISGVRCEMYSSIVKRSMDRKIAGSEADRLTASSPSQALYRQKVYGARSSSPPAPWDGCSR